MRITLSLLPHVSHVVFALLVSLQDIYIRNNQIGDEGITAFSSALYSGALASLQVLFVGTGPLGTDHPALKVVCEACGLDVDRWGISFKSSHLYK